MLSSRLCLSLVLGLSINASIASESLEDLSAVYSQGKHPIVIAKKKDPRQRGDCGTSPNVWALNLCQSRKFCYTTPSEVSLWLEKRPKGTATVLIENSDTSDSIELSWRKSDTTLDWPEKSVPISSGAIYQIKIQKRKFTFEKEISLFQIPPELGTAKAKAEWMNKNGCKSQAEMLQSPVTQGS
jgi:hypothetical protein